MGWIGRPRVHVGTVIRVVLARVCLSVPFGLLLVEAPPVMQRFMSLRRVSTTAVCLVLVASFTVPVHAANRFWDGTGGNDLWNNSANWSGGNPPGFGVGDDVFFDDNVAGVGQTEVNVNVNQAVDSITIRSDINYLLFGGSFLTLQGAGNVVQSFTDGAGPAIHTINNKINIQSNGTWVIQTGADLVVNGVISNMAGPGQVFSVTKTGAGKLTLTGNNTYGGGTVVSGGRLVVNTGSLPTANGVTVNNAFLEFNQSANGTYSGVISGNASGRVDKTGNGKLTLTANNSGFTGGVNVNGGTLEIGGSTETLNNNSAVTVAGGATLRIAGDGEGFGSLAGAGNAVLASPMIVGINNASTTFSGSLSGGATFAKRGTGTMKLTGNNSGFTGLVEVKQGTLEVGVNDSLGSVTPVTVANGATLRIAGNGELFGSVAGTGNVVMTQPMSVGVNNQSTTLSGVLSGSGLFTKAGTGTMTLSGANTHTGGTQILAGTLAIAGGSTPSSLTEILSNGTLLVNGGTFNANGDVNVNGGSLTRASGSFNLAAGKTLTASNNAQVSFTGLYNIANGTTFNFNSGADLMLDVFLQVAIGNNAVGTLNVSGGSTVTSTGGDVAGSAGSNGIVTITGENSIWQTTSTLFLATDTNTVGTIDIENKGHMTNGAALIGSGTTAMARVTVTGDQSNWMSQGNINLGPSGSDGQIIVKDLAVAETSGTLTVFPTGKLTVDTGGTFNANGGINNSGVVQLLGSQINTSNFVNTGTFTHQDGTLTVNGGTFDPGTASHIIDGADTADLPVVKLINGASATLSGQLRVGSNFNGELRLENGSIMDVGSAAVFGDFAGSHGTVVIDGSTLNITGLLVTGQRTDSKGGDITIRNGGALTAGGVQFASGNGTNIPITRLTVDGATSSVTSTVNLDIGGGGLGDLFLKNGGVANATNTLHIFPNGRLIGNGQVNANLVRVFASTTAQGMVNPGQTGQTGRLAINGNYLQESDAVLQLDIAGTSGSGIPNGNDLLTITANAALNGTLDVQVDPGFTPAYGNTFEILTYGSRTGAFDQATVNGSILALQTDLALAPVYDFPGSTDPLFAATPFAAAPDSLMLFTTLPGDANLDLQVEDADLSLLLTNFGNTDAPWTAGDFTGDGIVDDADLSLLLTNFGGDVRSPFSSTGLSINVVTIPEPATLTLFSLGCLLLARRRAANGD